MDVVVVECAQDQNRARLLGNGRCVRHLAPRRHGGGRQEARAVEPVVAELDVFGNFGGHEVSPVGRNDCFAFVEGLFERFPALKGDRVSRAIRTVFGGQRNRWVEEYCAPHEFGSEGDERQRQQATERVTHHIDRFLNPFSVQCLEQIVEVRDDIPRWLPTRTPVPTQVDRDHVTIGSSQLGELPVAQAVAGDAMDCEERLAV